MAANEEFEPLQQRKKIRKAETSQGVADYGQVAMSKVLWLHKHEEENKYVKKVRLSYRKNH